MEDNRSLKDEIRELKEVIIEKEKEKKFKLPWKAKLGKNKLKKGWIIVMTFKDNRNVDFERQPVEDSTYKIKDGTIHTTEDKDVFFYKGKPIVLQPTKRLNPHNPLSGENQTYGQKYVMAKMLAEVIKKSKKISGMLIFIIIAGLIAAYYFFTRGGGVGG